MWKCPVCETEYGDVTVCPRCGFDGSCDYEHYPTVFAVAGAKSTRALRREWEQKQGISTWWVLLSYPFLIYATAGAAFPGASRSVFFPPASWDRIFSCCVTG